MPKHAASRSELEHLEQGSELLGIHLSSSQIDAFGAYLSLLSLWNSKINLTSIRDPLSVARLHFLDSLAVSPDLDPGASLVDVGSGAGFPGLPIKIAFPQKEITLVESKRKKASFLKEAVRHLNLRGIRVLEGRVDSLQPDKFQFDEAITRAFSDPSEFLNSSHRILSKTGRSYLMQGPKGTLVFKRLAETSKQLSYRDARVRQFILPLGTEQRTLLIFSK